MRNEIGSLSTSTPSQSKISSPATVEGGYGSAANGGPIGDHVDWGNRSTRVGYWLDEGHQGRVTMTAAVQLLVDHALRAWELNRVEIIVATENHRSRAIPERLGFRTEGTLRQFQLVGGRYLDCVSYSMLAAEWRPDKSMTTALSS